MKRLYICTSETIHSHDSEYEIRKITPGLFKAYPDQILSIKVILCNIYWWIVTKGKYHIWCAFDDKRVVHTSYVVPKCSKFSFLSNDSYEIGPCNTNTDYRGKGIYPAVLATIVARVGTAYMIIDDNNISSIRGGLKVGFVLQPGEVKRDKLKRYNYVRGK